MERDEINTIYLFVCGRHPTEEEIESLSSSRNRSELLNIIVQIKEFFKNELFHQTESQLEQRRVSLPKLRVDIDVAGNVLSSLFRLTEQSWRKLGEEEPYWSVVTAPQFKSTVIDTSQQEFYASGADAVANFLSTLDRVGVEISKIKRVLELGCGVGRITKHLCQYFDHVTGIDISQPHLDWARRHFASFGIKNAEFVKINNPSDYAHFSNYDCIFSFIVLQHNSPPIIKVILKQLFGNANPDAIAYFQIPTYIEGYQFDAESYIARSHVGMEMHCLPQQEIFSCMKETGFFPLEIQNNALTDYRFTSFRYLARKVYYRN